MHLISVKKNVNMSPAERIDFVNSSKHCYNCLSSFHETDKCESEYKCGFCGFKHHTMLHLKSKLTLEPKVTDQQTSQEAGVSGSIKQTYVSNCDEKVIFPTAKVNVSAKNGAKLILRALVDACSDVSYISEHVVQKLQLVKKPTRIETAGLSNSNTGISNAFVPIQLQSLYDTSFQMYIKAYVIPVICARIPTHKFPDHTLVPKGIILEDSTFNIPSKIDILLGGIVDAKTDCYLPRIV